MFSSRLGRFASVTSRRRMAKEFEEVVGKKQQLAARQTLLVPSLYHGSHRIRSAASRAFVPTPEEAEGLPEQPVISNSDALMAQISLAASQKRWTEIIDLFRCDRTAREAITSRCIQQASSILKSAGRPDKVLDLLSSFERTMALPLIFSLHTDAISAFAINFDWEGAVGHLKKMEKLGLYPNIFIVNTVIQSFTRNGPLSKAIDILTSYTNNGLKANVYTFNILIGVCAKRGNAEAMQKFLHNMKSDGIVPDKVSYTIAISTYGKVGQWEKALAAFEDMQEQNIKPDLIAWNSLLDALITGNRYDLAESMLREMEELGVKIETSTYNIMMKAAMSKSCAELAKTIMETMEKSSICPDVVTYSSIISICALNNRLEEAEELFSQMIDRNIEPDALAYNWLIICYVKAKKYDEAFRFGWQLFSNRNFRPDIILIRKLIRASEPNEQFIDQMYSLALRNNWLNPYKILPIRRCKLVMDCHYFDFPLVKAAVRHELQKVKRIKAKVDGFWIGIITAKNLQVKNFISNGAVIQLAVTLGLRYRIPDRNKNLVMLQLK